MIQLVSILEMHFVKKLVWIQFLKYHSPNAILWLNSKLTCSEWQAQGDTDVKSAFVRLTPDRQSKRGTLWSRESIGPLNELSATLTFRISGQGKKLFGDGIGLWLTQYTRQQPGNVHGLDASFTGVGIIIDTFKNVEHGKNHRDITVIVNDGQKDIDLIAVSNLLYPLHVKFFIYSG